MLGPPEHSPAVHQTQSNCAALNTKLNALHAIVQACEVPFGLSDRSQHSCYDHVGGKTEKAADVGPACCRLLALIGLLASHGQPVRNRTVANRRVFQVCTALHWSIGHQASLEGALPGTNAACSTSILRFRHPYEVKCW